MRRSRELDNILDECLERILHGETMEQCLQRFPGHAAELRPLLETARLLTQSASFSPRPEFREEARHRFQAVLLGTARKSRESFPRRFWQPRWVTMVAVILAVIMAGGGTVAAAGASMPDQPLYPVKIAVEQTWLALTPSSLGKAELYARLTERRMTEIARMVDQDKPERVEEVAKRVDVFLTRVEALSAAEWRPAEQKLEALPSAEQDLAGPGAMPRAFPTPVAPPPSGVRRGMVERSLAAEMRSRDDTEDGAIKFNRRAQLRARIRHYAANHPARLRALLRDAPESALPALLRAIAVSEDGYDRALRSLDDK